MVYIKSILPNPVGKDAGNEWIRISNDGPEAVNLSGWKIQDEGGAAYPLSPLGSIGSEEVVELQHALTEINLNNNGDMLSLYDGYGALVDEFGYAGPVEEGEILLGRPLVAEEINQNLEGGSAEILEAGILGGASAGSSFWEPILLGFLVAASASALFIYLSINVFKKND